MSFLLDTHTLIWSILEKGKLSSKVSRTLEDTEKTIFVSCVSFWEISIKFSLGKLSLLGLKPEGLADLSAEIGYELLSLSPHDCTTYHQLNASFHKDPFDRMLIWQALRHDYFLVTKDTNINHYEATGLKTFW